MKKVFSYTHILILTLFTAFVSGQSGFDKTRQDSLLTLLEQKEKAMGSLAVMDKGQVIYSRAIGFLNDSPTKIPSDIKTRYRIGSISKMFTSVMIFQLIEQNKLQLETPLGKFYPAIQNSAKITIGNMLNHRSGIHSFTNDSLYRTYMTKPKTKDEIIEMISSYKPDFEPGSKFEYSNSNYVLLGYIVEKLRKDSYEKILQKYICTKAGLSDTHYGGKTDPSKNETYSYSYTGEWDRMPETDMSIPHGAGAIVSTPTDLVKFISALFDGKLVSKASTDRMLVISDGMGSGIQKFPYENKIVYGHGGGIDGFSSILVYVPEERLAVAYCSNGTIYSVNSILLYTLNNYYGKHDKLPQFRVYTVDPAELDKYTGTYSNKMVPIKITISKNNNRLFGQGSGQPPFPLEGSAKDEFRFETAGILIRFHMEKNQMALIQGGQSITFTREE